MKTGTQHVNYEAAHWESLEQMYSALFGTSQMGYEPQLPAGGIMEATIEKRLVAAVAVLEKIDRHDLPLLDLSDLRDLSLSYGELGGSYYRLRRLTASRARMIGDALRALQALPVEDPVSREMQWCVMCLRRGEPARVSNFTMEGCFMLLGRETDRVVRITGSDGLNHGLHALTARDLTFPRDFRNWLAKRGLLVWTGGEAELEALRRDLMHACSFRRVQIPVVQGPENSWPSDALTRCGRP